MSGESWQIKEWANDLVRCVTSAFYTDDVVAVMELMIRENYITLYSQDFLYYQKACKERLKTRTETWMRERLNTLCNDHMVQRDKYDKRDYYYIDYEYFVNVLKYRIRLMEKEVKKNQRSMSNFQNYVCSLRCHEKLYTDRDVAKIGSEKCPKCRPKGRLVPQGVTRAVKRQIGLISKMRTQLQPILELLGRLKGKKLDTLQVSPSQLKAREIDLKTKHNIRTADEEHQLREISKGTNSNYTRATTNFAASIGGEDRFINVNYVTPEELERAAKNKRLKVGPAATVKNTTVPKFLHKSAITKRQVYGTDTSAGAAPGASGPNGDGGTAESLKDEDAEMKKVDAAMFGGAPVVATVDEMAAGVAVVNEGTGEGTVYMKVGGVDVEWGKVDADDLDDEQYQEYQRLGRENGLLAGEDDSESDDDF